MKDPWKKLARKPRGPAAWRARLAAAGSVLLGAGLLGAAAASLTGLSAAKEARNNPDRVYQAEVAALRAEIDDLHGKLNLADVRLARETTIRRYSTDYQIPADLAEAIYDIALAETLEPDLAFRLVKVESRFRSDARSHKAAIGYTQLRIRTAREYDSTLTELDLLDRDTNLRYGFRFLKDLMNRYGGDYQTALVAYNRGPSRVDEIRARGEDPDNGYAGIVMKKVRTGS
jgi:soluble lytic murein transglycosylase-like protein